MKSKTKATTTASRFRVVVRYLYKRRKGGVALGCIIEADDIDAAIDAAVRRHVTAYPSRVYHSAVACEL